METKIKQTSESILEKLIRFFKENASSASSCKEITECSDLKNDLGLDSLDFVELIMKLEDQFEIKIADEDANKLVTIGDVAKLIKTLKDAKSC